MKKLNTLAQCVAVAWLIIATALGVPLWQTFLYIIFCAVIYGSVVEDSKGHFAPKDAINAFNRGEYEQCAEFCERWVSARPNSPVALTISAAVYRRMNESEKAADFDTRAISACHSFAEAFANRAQAYLMIFEWHEALRDCGRAIELKPDLCAAFVIRAGANYFCYRFEESIADCNKALTVDEKSAAAYVYRAMANLSLNENDRATEDCKRAKDLDTNGAISEIRLVQAGIYSSTKRIPEAIAEYTNCIELKLQIDPALCSRAHCYCMQGEIEKAIEDLNMLESKPLPTYLSGYVHSNRARIELKKGNLPGAMELAMRAIKLLPGTPSILSTHGLACCRNKRAQEAEISLDQAIAINPHYAEAYSFRAELYEVTGRTSQAQADRLRAEEYHYMPYL